jgi:hypothetical protein
MEEAAYRGAMVRHPDAASVRPRVSGEPGAE